MDNNQLIQRLNNAESYFTNRIEMFDNLSRGVGKRDSIINFREGFLFTTFVGIIGFFVYCWKYFLTYFDWYMNDSTMVEKMLKWMDSFMPLFIAVIIGFILLFVCFILAYVLGFILFSIIVMVIKTIITIPSYTKVNNQIENNLDHIKRAYLDYESINGEPCPVPIDRCHPQLIREILNILLSYRADNIKDAINIIVQDEHNNAMEKLTVEQIKAIEKGNKYLKDISKTVKRIEWNTFWNI